MKRLGTELYLGVKFININLYSKRQFNISRHTEKSMGNEKKNHILSALQKERT